MKEQRTEELLGGRFFLFAMTAENRAGRANLLTSRLGRTEEAREAEELPFKLGRSRLVQGPNNLSGANAGCIAVFKGYKVN